MSRRLPSFVSCRISGNLVAPVSKRKTSCVPPGIPRALVAGSAPVIVKTGMKPEPPGAGIRGTGSRSRSESGNLESCGLDAVVRTVNVVKTPVGLAPSGYVFVSGLAKESNATVRSSTKVGKNVGE